MAFNGLMMTGGHQEGFPGPRDWSPAMEASKRRLKALQTLVPEGFLVPLLEVQESGFGEIAALVELGFAFLIRLGNEVHLVYVSSMGRLHMDLTVTNFFMSLAVTLGGW